MGPLLMTGLACFGAAMGIGLLVSSAVLPDGSPERRSAYRVAARSLVMILTAFAEGVAVIGVVIGLLAVELGHVADPADGILAAGPALIGSLIGLGLIVTRVASIDGGTALIGAMFILGIGLLGVVVAGLAWFIAAPGAPAAAPLPFTILGLVSGASALAIGITGGRGVRAIPDLDADGLKAYQATVVARSLPFQLAAIGASAVGVLLVVLA